MALAAAVLLGSGSWSSSAARADGAGVSLGSAEVGTGVHLVVPAGVCSIAWHVVGGQGGLSSLPGWPAGLGGEVDAVTAVTAGESLYLEVGGSGHLGSQHDDASGGRSGSARSGGTAESGSSSDSESGGGGGGGGASAVRAGTNNGGTPLIIAGGGGGAGSYSAGGNAGASGAAGGTYAIPNATYTGGGGATSSAPGVAGVRTGGSTGIAGDPGNGARGGFGWPGSGGGGGGQHGGGSGASLQTGWGTGGGGGSNLAPSGATMDATSTHSGDGVITGTYTHCSTGVPGPPLAVVTTANNASVHLEFHAPASDGGSPITSYEVSTDGGLTWHHLATAGTGPYSGTVHSLVNGTVYPVEVRAVNSTGPGPGSPAVSATPHSGSTPTPTPGPAGAPTPTTLTSDGVGTEPQSATVPVVTGDTVTLLDENGHPATRVVVVDVGSYTLDPRTNAITFVAVDGFSGTAEGVAYRVTNSHALSATALYVPTVIEPEAPRPASVSSRGPGVQHARVAVPVDGSVTLIDPAGHEVGALTVPGRGTFRLGAAGLITFTPEAGFAGRPPAVRFRVTDDYGQTGEAGYQADVVAVPAGLPTIDRSNLVAIPADPAAVTGPERRTKAYESSYRGIDALPVSELGDHLLVAGEATTLDTDGLFGFDSAVLTRAGRAQVKAAARNLRTVAAITCEGYTDYAGTLDHEIALSRQRARAVCAALRTDGVRVAMQVRGYGPARPAVVGGTPISREENRRVVIVVR